LEGEQPSYHFSRAAAKLQGLCQISRDFSFFSTWVYVNHLENPPFSPSSEGIKGPFCSTILQEVEVEIIDDDQYEDDQDRTCLQSIAFSS